VWIRVCKKSGFYGILSDFWCWFVPYTLLTVTRPTSGL
jgi:hypothetical protein